MTSPLQITECKTAADVMASARRLRPPVKTPVVRFLPPSPVVAAKLNRRKAKAQLISRAESPVSANEPKAVSALRVVAQRYGMTPREVIATARGNMACKARQEIMYRLRTEFGMSGPAIAREMGLSHHAVVFYGASAHAVRNGLPMLTGKLHHLVEKRSKATPRKLGRPRKSDNGETK